MTMTQAMKQGVLFFDGGTGSFLQERGLGPGEKPECWNLKHPDVITELHYRYFLAGANIIKTNTFGANRLKFQAESGEETLETVVTAALKHAQEAKRRVEEEPVPPDALTPTGVPAAQRPHFIALDIGPSGKLLEPLGDLDFEDAVALFAETIRIGAAQGADLVLIETMSDSYETKAAVLAAKENCDLPVFVTNVYNENGKLLTGADPAAMTTLLEGLRVDACGMNCSIGPAQMKKLVPGFLEGCSLPLIVNPNAGLPHTKDGKPCYDVTAEEFAAHIGEIVELGARLVGGCCGTTPEYICRLVELCQNKTAVPVAVKNRTRVSSRTHAVEIGHRPVLVGERINPTGKPKLKQALREHDMDYLLDEALDQAEKGMDILDVNVGLPEVDEAVMLTDAVTCIQDITDLPLQLDTSDYEAMERALRRYNGKAMINSVSGKATSMRAVFPLVEKYGGVVVALTLDEGGIPDTADGRIAIAEKIYRTAAEYGIEKKDIIVDPLAMAVSSNDKAALATLETLRRIRDDLGGNTILGVSNISFGLPQRELITAAFFTMAMQNGLSAAILNPNSAEIRKAHTCFCTLSGYDPRCADYIAFAEQYVPAGAAVPAAVKPAAPSGPADAALTPAEQNAAIPGTLEYAITRGLAEQAAAAAAELLHSRQSLDVINEQLIPALDIVGRGFEANRVYLPQLLMSAEAAKKAFDAIKDALAKTGEQQEKKGTILLATVYGDIHDIGKNIVKVLLENYGYQVIDLGKDVLPETIVERCVRETVPLVGLSALMTTTVPAMAETIRLLREQAPWCKTVVGGAVLTRQYAETIHADFYAKDAMETVAVAKQIFGA